MVKPLQISGCQVTAMIKSLACGSFMKLLQQFRESSLKRSTSDKCSQSKLNERTRVRGRPLSRYILLLERCVLRCWREEGGSHDKSTREASDLAVT